ncbi:MAG: transglutaminase domain-containing protein [Ginsengibacter sp.]
MKMFFFFILFFGLGKSTFAQDDHYAAERIFVSIPKSQTQTSADIAAYINSHFHSDKQKVAAIYSWITMNIKYDADSIHYVILDEDNEQRVSFALRRKKGVCENFAAVFTDLCSQCGINSYVVEGFTKQGGYVDASAHVWCVALVDNKWDFYDPTWDAVRVGSNNFNLQYKYFNVPPVDFIQTHFPFDPIFQLLNYPIRYNDFAMGNTQPVNRKNYFNYPDSLEAFQKMSRLSQYASEESRIENAGWPANKIETKLKRIRLQAEVLNQDNDADLYNSAVSDYNAAINYLNNFLSYRNNQFQPPKSKEEVEKIFQNVSISIESANLKLKKINSSGATLQLDTGDIQRKLNDLQTNLKQQENYFKNYTDSSNSGK